MLVTINRVVLFMGDHFVNAPRERLRQIRDAILDAVLRYLLRFVQLVIPIVDVEFVVVKRIVKFIDVSVFVVGQNQPGEAAFLFDERLQGGRRQHLTQLFYVQRTVVLVERRQKVSYLKREPNYKV